MTMIALLGGRLTGVKVHTVFVELSQRADKLAEFVDKIIVLEAVIAEEAFNFQQYFIVV